MTLKKRSLQIGSFVKSTVGSQIFSMINADSVINTVNSMDIDVVSGNVTDKYGTLRTCVNEPERQLITCNLWRTVEHFGNYKKTEIATMVTPIVTIIVDFYKFITLLTSVHTLPSWRNPSAGWRGIGLGVCRFVECPCVQGRPVRGDVSLWVQPPADRALARLKICCGGRQSPTATLWGV